jgi:hypothetical protein
MIEDNVTVYVDYYDKPAIRGNVPACCEETLDGFNQLGLTRGNLLLNFCTVNTNFCTWVGPYWANNLQVLSVNSVYRILSDPFLTFFEIKQS